MELEVTEDIYGGILIYILSVLNMNLWYDYFPLSEKKPEVQASLRALVNQVLL